MKQDKIIFTGSVFVLLSALYYVIFSNPIEQKENILSKVATTTESEVATTTLETTLSTSTQPKPDSRFNTKEWSLTYKNTTYGFSLVFPEMWKTYRAQEISNGVWFGIEDQDQVFLIQKYTQEEWNNELVKNKTNTNNILPTVIKKNTTHVFVVSRAKEFTSAVMPLIITYPSILTTFTLLEK